MSVLQLSGVSKRFGGVQALSEVSLSVSSGEVLGLIGPNGAGKSTLVSCITGVLRIDGGTIRFQDGDIQRLAPHPRGGATRHRAHVPEGATCGSTDGLRKRRGRAREPMVRACERMGLGISAAVGAKYSAGREPHAGAGRAQ